jgi:tetratricopeptide (TPR) repeat protein
MNRLLVTAVAAALAFNVSAQSVPEGEKMINYGRYQSAQKSLEPLAAKDAKANYYLGIAKLELEDIAGAQATFAKFPDDFYNQAGTARVLFLQNKRDEASKILLAIVDKAKKKDWEKYKVAADAITYTTGGNFNDAITWYKKALEINPTDANILINMGDAYLRTAGGGGEAMTSYESAVEKGNNNSLAYSRIGALWYRAQKYDDALKNYELAKNADPSNPLPYHDLADAYQRAGRYENALTNIEKFLELSDKSIDDQITYANLLFLSKKYPEAQAKIQELIGKGVSKPYLYRLIAYSAFETKDYTKAQENMRLFYSKQDPAKIIPEDYIYSGKIMAALGVQDSSKAKMYNDSATYYFDKVVTADTSKDKRALYLQIADAFKESKDYAKVGSWYGRIIAENPDASSEDYFYWGYWSFVGKNYAEATKAFQMMRAKYPDEPSGIYWQGRVAAAMDSEAKTGGAVQYYKDWLAVNKEGYVRKPADLMNAYQYLLYYYYNSNNEKDAMEYVNKILEQEPGNEFANQIKDYYANAKAAPKAGAGKTKKTK